MTLESPADRIGTFFAKCFARPHRWLAAAPGRVNLIGEHTDYNDGFVLPMAIDRYTVIAADKNSDRQVRIYCMTSGESATINLRGPVERGDPPWSNYIRGVIAGFQRRGLKVGGFDAVMNSNVPLGGGLSSSAAMEVAVATLLEALTNHKLDPIEKALLCQKAEHEFAGVPCGIMDQFTSVLGQENHLLLLDCRTRETRLVPMSDPAVAVLIINTNVRHKLADGEYAKRRATCEAAAKLLGVRSLREVDLARLEGDGKKLDPLAFRRVRHVVTENDRTLKAARALSASDWSTVGKLMYDSHASLRDDYEVSCPELDVVVESALEIGEQKGMIGCRMTGGGFGGCAVSLVRTEAAQRITKQLSLAYERKTNHTPFLFTCRPGSGARMLAE